jgi:carbonic anhydrase
MPSRLLPEYLVRRYQGWRATTYAENRSWYRHLASDGQHPRAMIISCCDSRVHVTSIFGADQGEFFIHRNIANLVPPFAPDGDHHGTSAAVEYAVNALRVAHIIVLGHSGCGGSRAATTCVKGMRPSSWRPRASSAAGWTSCARGYEALPPGEDAARLRALEKLAVRVSLDNLMTFPFVRASVEDGRLTLHGLWNEIGEGAIEVWDEDGGAFVPV